MIGYVERAAGHAQLPQGHLDREIGTLDQADDPYLLRCSLPHHDPSVFFEDAIVKPELRHRLLELSWQAQ